MIMERQPFDSNQSLPPPPPPYHQEYWHYRPGPPSGLLPPPPPPPPHHSRSPYTPPAYRHHRPYPENEERVMGHEQQQHYDTQQQLHHSSSWNSANNGVNGDESYRNRDDNNDRQRRLLRHRQQQLHSQNILRPRMNDGHSPSSATSGGYYNNAQGDAASPPYNENPYYSHRPSGWDEYPHSDNSPKEGRDRFHHNMPHSPKMDSRLRAADSFDTLTCSPVPYEQMHSSSSTSEGYYPEEPFPEDDGINVISPSRQSPSAPYDFSRRYPPSSPLRAVPIDSFDSFHDEHAFLPPPSSCRALTEKKRITPDKTKLTPSISPVPVPPSKTPVALDMSHVNNNDVLCGRGGGTNSQVGNRRFRQLVQDHQPQYLTARRKEKPMIARKIVRIIRQRGGRFMKRDDATEHLFEVGDNKAEAKTSQALREGLDVRATKGASTLLSKKKEGVPVSRSCSFATPDRSHIAKSTLTEDNKRKASEISVNELNENERKLFLDFSPPRSSKMSKSGHKTITPCRSYDSKSSFGDDDELCKKEDDLPTSVGENAV